MSLVPFKDFWTEFAEKFSAVCPDVPPTQLKPIFEELEASIERRINQAVDEAAAKAAEKIQQDRRRQSISFKRQWASVRCGNHAMDQNDAKRLKAFWETAEKFIGSGTNDIELLLPKKHWEDAEHDPAIGETVVDEILRDYQCELVYDKERFRPISAELPYVLEEYKKVVPPEKRSRKVFFQIYKASPVADTDILDLAKILRKRIGLHELLQMASEINPSAIGSLSEAIKFND